MIDYCFVLLFSLFLPQPLSVQFGLMVALQYLFLLQEQLPLHQNLLPYLEQFIIHWCFNAIVFNRFCAMLRCIYICWMIKKEECTRSNCPNQNTCKNPFKDSRCASCNSSRLSTEL